MPTTRTRRIAARLGVFAAALALTGFSTVAVGSAQEAEPSETQSPTAEPATGPDEDAAPNPPSIDALEISATLDKDEYESDDQVTVTFVVTNTGDKELGKLTGRHDGDLRVSNDAALQDFLFTGFTLPAGETFTVDLTGYMRDIADGSFDYTIGVTGPRDDDGFANHKQTTVTAPVTVTTGTYTGTVYADKNENGEFDDGEELPDVTVKLSDTSWDSTEATTGDDGAFAFEDITTGRYQVEFQAPGGWYVTQEAFHVQVSTDGLHEVFAAVRPLSERLEASIEFGASTYHLDDTVSFTISLTNTGKSRLVGVEGYPCNGVGNSNQLTQDENWGPLDVGAGGVTLKPGESKVIEVTGAEMPSGAAKFGSVAVSCDFVSRAMGIHYDGAMASAEAEIVDEDDDSGSGSDNDSGSDDGSGEKDGSGPDGDGSGAGDGSDGGSASGGSSGSAEDDLALTGFGGMEILWIGLATLAAGALALWYARRRRTATEAGELG